MQIKTIEELVNCFRNSQKTLGVNGSLFPKNEKVFKKMSFEELNEALKNYGLKCLIHETNCCAETHDHLICEINYIPPFPISFNDPRLSNLE